MPRRLVAPGTVVAVLSGLLMVGPAQADQAERAPAATLTLEVSPRRLPAISLGPYQEPSVTLSGSLKGADGDPLPGQVLEVGLVEDDGVVKFGTTATTDAQGGYRVTRADRFGSHLTARVTWSANGSKLVAKKEIEVGFIRLRTKYWASGVVNIAFESFLEQGPDVYGFVVQRSSDGVRWKNVRTVTDRYTTSVGFDGMPSSYWRLVSLDDGTTPSVASKVFELRRWSTYFARPKLSVRKARYGKRLTISGKMGRWADLRTKKPAARREIRLVLDCDGPGGVYRVAKTRTDGSGRFSFRTKASCNGNYYVSYGMADETAYSPAYYAGEFASLSLPVKIKTTSVPRGAKPQGKAIPYRKKMPSPAFIRSLGRYPDRFGAP
ncbi:hypothetical protein GCM10010439_37140 [Actinocorallia aurantiaca]|uniref:Carboxypeptidase family protein n=1 Tax=Actinocorallia aurantiaca TaxID=46204 RepID=A0ABP6GS94_9ACTN